MKRIVFISLVLIALFAGLYAGPAFVEYDGYILVVMEDGTLQMSIFGFLFMLVALAISAWLLFIVGRHVFRALTNYSQWIANFSDRKRKQAFTNGLLSLAEGDLKQSQLLLEKVKDEDFGGIQLIALADIASKQSNTTATMEYLELARANPVSKVAATVQLMKYFMANGKPEEAIRVAQISDANVQNNPSVVKQWARALGSANKWHELREKVSHWKKPLGDQFEHWKQQAANGEFAEVASKHGAMQLQADWKALPRSDRKNASRQHAYIEQLIHQGMHIDAEKMLLDAQKSKMQPALLSLMGQLKLQNPAATIKKLESWIKADEHNGDLYSVLGRVAYASHDHILAEKALTKAVHLRDDKDDILLLAELEEAQNNVDQALALYKKIHV